MNAPIQLVLRLADRPLPPPAGDMHDRLGASLRHARTCTWAPVADLLKPKPSTDSSTSALRAKAAWRWGNGAGTTGLRVGLVFREGDQVWLPHPAPGEVSPTTGLDLRDVAIWLNAFRLSTEQRLAHLDIQEQHFSVQSTATSRIITAMDWDGTVEDRLKIPRRGDLDALPAHIEAIARAAQELELALPGLERVRGLVG